MTGAGFVSACVAGVGLALRLAVFVALFSFGAALALAYYFVAAFGWLLALAFAFVLAGGAGAA